MFLCSKWLGHPYPTVMNILFILQIKAEKEEVGQQSGVQVGVLKSWNSVDNQNLISHERDKDQKKHWQRKLLPDLCVVPLLDVLCIVKTDRISDFFFPVWMQPLEEASKYFLKQGIPFPKIHLSEEEKKNLKECYIFEDAETPGAPTVVFFPLVNDTFRKYKEPGKLWDRVGPPTTHPPFSGISCHGSHGEECGCQGRDIGLHLESRMYDHLYALSMTSLDLAGVERSPAEMAEGNVDVSSLFSPYCINSFTYTEDQFDKLVKLTSYNIQNNKHLILQALSSAIEQKQQHKKWMLSWVQKDAYITFSSPAEESRPVDEWIYGLGKVLRLISACSPSPPSGNPG